MTTTLASARSRLRTALEDSSGSPLWADGTLDEGLKRSLDDYRQWSPAQATTTFTATAGDTTAAVPSGALKIERVTDPNGWVIPEQQGDPLRYVGDVELSWSLFAGDIQFTRPLIAGDYTVWYYTARAFPSADGNNFDIPDSDIPLLVAGGVVYALEVRLVQEGKRGSSSETAMLLTAARRYYGDAWRERRRVVRSSTLRSSS
jgi:hypothetical protein